MGDARTIGAKRSARRVGGRRRPRPDVAGLGGPRERLASLGVRALAAHELVALLLRTGHRDAGAEAIAREILEEGGGLAGLATASLAELAARPGLGPAKAASLIAACELGRRLAERPLQRGRRVGGPGDIERHFGPRLGRRDRESFHVLLLDARHRLIGEEEISVGTLTASLVHPREVFRGAIRAAAAAIVLVHNHPSGDPSPSEEDRAVTDRLAEAGRILGIEVLDHVVVATGGHWSFREAGALPLAIRPQDSRSAPRPGHAPVRIPTGK